MLKTEKLTCEQAGLTKSVEITAIFMREATNMTTLKPMRAFFRVTLRISIPKERAYANQWIFSSKEIERPHIRFLDKAMGVFCGLTYAIDWNNADYCHKIGKETRISPEKAKAMLDAHEAIMTSEDLTGSPV